MKRLALPIILILALVLVTAFGCVQDENIPETPPDDGQTNVGGGETSSGEQDADDDQDADGDGEQDADQGDGEEEKPDPDPEPVEPVQPDDYRDRAEGVEYGTVQEIEYYSEVAGGTKHATVLLPVDAVEGKRYPVLYLLHGLMCDESTWFDLCSATEIVRNAQLFEGASEMIVVGVNSIVNEDEVAPPMLSEEVSEVYDKTGKEIVEVLKPYIDSHYPTLTGKWDTAVAGFSMGGREALLSAFTYQDTFGYIGAFSSASFNRNIVSVGVQDPVLDEFVVEHEYGGFRYILLNIGRLDFMTAGVTQRYDEMMTESGIEHEFYLTNGGHDFSTWADGLHTFVLNIFGAGDSAV